MRVSLVMAGRLYGGAEYHFCHLARGLVERGHQVQAVFAPGAESEHHLPHGHPGLSTARLNMPHAADPVGVWRLRRTLAGFGPDLVHAHLNRASGLVGRASRGRLRGAAPWVTVATLHGYYKPKYYRRLDYMVATTADERRYLLECGFAPERVFHVPNFLDPEAQRVRAAEPLAGPAPDPSWRPLIGTLGRMVHKKGFDTFLRAAALVCERLPEAGFVIVGDGSERRALEVEIERLGLGDRVLLAGWQRNPLAYLGRFDVFALPSRHEPFGIVALEAMALGVPVVTTRSEGPTEIFTEGEDGLMVDIEDADGLAAELVRVARDPDLGRRLAESAGAKLEREYTLEVVVSRLEELYNTLIHKGNGRSRT